MKLGSFKLPQALKRGALPIALLAVFFGGWYFGLPAKQSAGGGSDDTIWTCSMHPQVRQPNPGLCPICEMDLIPLEPGGETGLRELKVTPEAAALMDLRVSPVLRQPAIVDVRLFGKIAYDERNVTTTTARMGGRLDRFYVDYTGAEVRKGDHIAEIYSPDLFVAQQDLIKATRGLAAARRTGTAAAVETQQRLLKTARERLRLLQLTERQIDAIAEQAEPTDHITLFAPQDGVVTKRHVVEGAYVKTGDPLFAVAGLKSVWLNLEAYESDVPWLHFAQQVSFAVEAISGEVFHGRIAYIDPEFDDLRRIVRVRVNVDNPRRLLKPGMFARAKVEAKVSRDGSVIDPGLAGTWISPMHPEVIRKEPGKCPICGMDLVPAEELGFIATGGGEHGNALLVPDSAVLRTGSRAVVYVRLKASPEPVFEGREVVLGARVGRHFVVDSGLSEGEMVVTRGAFKLDSELQLKARPSMMNRDAGLVETPAGEAEEGLLGQWGAVPRALGRLRNAAYEGNQSAAVREMGTIIAAVERVNVSSFHPKTASDWNEFSGRLRNTVVLAQRRPEGELPLIYRDVRHAVEEAGRYLGLPFEPPQAPRVPDSTLITALNEILAAYLEIGKQLSGDDADGAYGQQPRLGEAVAKLPESEGVPAVREAAAGFAKAKGIEEMRKAFKPLSVSLIALVKMAGIDRVGDAYVVHCPMVNDYEGADWLSAVPKIENPYFGSEMYDCGVLKANLSFDAGAMPQPEKKAGREGHDAHEGHGNHDAHRREGAPTPPEGSAEAGPAAAAEDPHAGHRHPPETD